MKIITFINKSAFMNSLNSINKKFIHIIFLDFLYYTILLFTGSFYIYRILPKAMQIMDVAELIEAGKAFSSADELIMGMASFSAEWLSFKIWTAVIVVFLILNYVVFKYLIWNKIQDKHQKLKQAIKSMSYFALLNIIIIIIALLALVLSWYIFTLEFFNIMFFLVVPVLAIYSINLLHPLFVKSESIKISFAHFINIGIKKFYLFIIPYLIMIIGLYLVMRILPVFLFVPDALYFVLYVLVFSAYFSWCKYYIFAIIMRVKNDNSKSE